MMSAWALKQNTVSVPEGTRKIRCILMGKRFAGNDNDSYIDNVFCKLYSGDLTCHTYSPPGPANGRIYVDTNAIGFPDGESWTTAWRNVGDALLQGNTDTSIDKVWIADGTYPVTTNTSRDTSFLVTRSISLFGGFAGHEATLSQRDISNHPTILSGEIGDTSLLHDNCYHVLEFQNVPDSLYVDGLIVRDGFADGPDPFGGGIWIAMSNKDPVIFQNCLVENNYAVQGSSVYNQAEAVFNSSAILNVVIEGTTGCSMLNAGTFATLKLINTLVEQECSNCPDVIQNIDGATLVADENVLIKKE